MAKAESKAAAVENQTIQSQSVDSNSEVGTPSLTLVTSDPKVDQAIVDATNELNAAATAASEVLGEDLPKTAKTSPEKPAARTRTQVTPAQRMRVAKRQREYGRKLLERNTAGVSSLMRPVKLNNTTIRMMFERTWPYIDTCAYLLERHGGFAVGDREATALLDALNKKVTAFRDEQVRNLAAAQAVGEVAAEDQDSVAPVFTQAMNMTVQVRSPIANLALDGFLKGDGVITELENLRWLNQRTLGDIEMETNQIRNQVRELGVFVVRTLNNLNSRYRARTAAA